MEKIKAIAKQSFLARLAEFKGLERNWDGENSDAVSDAVLALAKKVGDKLIDSGAKIDFCVPLRNGGVQIEFKLENDCEIEVHPNGEIFFLVYDELLNLTNKESITLEEIKQHVR